MSPNQVIDGDWLALALQLAEAATSAEKAARMLRKRASEAYERSGIRTDSTPKKVDRILWNAGRESIDEIVVHDCMVHVEQMDDRCWWIGIYKGDDVRWSGNFHCYRHKDGMQFTEQDDDLTWDRDEEAG